MDRYRAYIVYIVVPPGCKMINDALNPFIF